MCSTIRPTYRLSYDNAVELLQMNVEEEADLNLLDEVAQSRREWRTAQVSYLLKSPESVLSEVTLSDMYSVGSCSFCLLGWGEEKRTNLLVCFLMLEPLMEENITTLPYAKFYMRIEDRLYLT